MICGLEVLRCSYGRGYVSRKECLAPEHSQLRVGYAFFLSEPSGSSLWPKFLRQHTRFDVPQSTYWAETAALGLMGAAIGATSVFFLIEVGILPVS
jgi:hypothetical protein